MTKNPYLEVEGCVDRLYKEYQQHGKLIVALDFDDTLFDFHSKGYDYLDTISVIKRCQNLGFYIVLFTGVPKEKWDWQIKFCADLGINITSVNKNPINLPFGNDGKIYYNIFLDDRAGLGQAIEVLNAVLDKIEKKNFYQEAERV